jgi:esterase/lipase
MFRQSEKLKNFSFSPKKYAINKSNNSSDANIAQNTLNQNLEDKKDIYTFEKTFHKVFIDKEKSARSKV